MYFEFPHIGLRKGHNFIIVSFYFDMNSSIDNSYSIFSSIDNGYAILAVILLSG